MATHEARNVDRTAQAPSAGDPNDTDRSRPTGARLIELGDLSAESADFAGAVQHYREALATLNGDGARLRASVLRRISDCQLRLGEAVDAQSTALEAAHAMTEATPLIERVRIELQLARVRTRRGQLGEATRNVDAAMHLLVDTEPCLELGQALQLRGSIAHRGDDVDTAMRMYQDALTVFKDLGSLSNVARIYRNIGMLHRRACNWSRALECCQVSQNLMSIEGDYSGLPAVLQTQGILHTMLGQLDEALDDFEQSHRKSREIGDAASSALALAGKADVHLMREEYDRARELFWSALELSALQQHLYGMLSAYLGLTESALGAGNAADAAGFAAKAADISARLGRNRLEGELDRVIARVRALEGREGEAFTVASRGLESARTTSNRLLEARLLLTIGELHAGAGDHARADEAARQAVEILRRAGESFWLTRVIEFRGRLELESTDDRTRISGVQHLQDALDGYRALRHPRAEFRTLLAIADEDIRHRAVDRAAERLGRARELLGTLDGARALDDQLSEVQQRLECTFVENAVSTKDSLDAHQKMERVLKSDRSFDDKISEFLGVLTATIPCAGASMLDVASTDVRVIGAHGIPALSIGRSFARPSAFTAGWPASDRPAVFLGMASGNKRRSLGPLASGREVESAIAVPLRESAGVWSVLYVDRVLDAGNPEFHQAEVSYCMTLARQLAGFLEEASIRNRRGLRELDRIDRSIALADIVTENAEMRSILGLVSRVADSDLSVLLQGETGTGKKLIARALHLCSSRADAALTTVDCAALSESVLESELFGHVKGAFTGATHDRKGILEEAEGGTVFIDEIDKTTLEVQRRFLHLLDSGEVRAVGGHAYRPLDIRIVCATSADLRREVAEGRFLKDLYFRLNDITIHVPSLRRRKDDIPLLAEFFSDVFAQKLDKTIKGISRIAMQKLVEYDWPGNVRELEKVMRRAVTLADENETIGIDLLPSRLLESEVTLAPEPPARTGVSLREQLDGIERQIVQRALEDNAWNKSRAAVALGLSRKGLKNKIARYGLDRRA